MDTSNFDPEFTNEQPVDSVVDDSHMVRYPLLKESEEITKTDVS